MKAQRSDLPRVSFLLPDSFPPSSILPISFPPLFTLPNSFLPSTRQPLPQPGSRPCTPGLSEVAGFVDSCVSSAGGVLFTDPPSSTQTPPAAHRPPQHGSRAKWMNRNNQISQFQPLICHFWNFVFKIRFKIHYLQTVSYFKNLYPSFV